MADLIIAKHRNGGLDRIPLRFKGELTKFVNPDPEQGYEPPPEKAEGAAPDIPFVAPDEAAPF